LRNKFQAVKVLLWGVSKEGRRGEEVRKKKSGRIPGFFRTVWTGWGSSGRGVKAQKCTPDATTFTRGK
jgi:hypothetical protein